MTYRTASPPPPLIVELGPFERPSTWLLVVVVALGIVPALALVTGISALHAAPDRAS